MALTSRANCLDALERTAEFGLVPDHRRQERLLDDRRQQRRYLPATARSGRSGQGCVIMLTRTGQVPPGRRKSHVRGSHPLGGCAVGSVPGECEYVLSNTRRDWCRTKVLPRAAQGEPCRAAAGRDWENSRGETGKRPPPRRARLQRATPPALKGSADRSRGGEATDCRSPGNTGHATRREQFPPRTSRPRDGALTLISSSASKENLT